MERFLEQYGYLALMAGTFLEGETAILIASSLVHEGIFEIPLTVLFAFVGCFISDWVYYLIGIFNGRYFLAKRPKLQAKLKPVQHFLQTNSTAVLIVYRFLYGFRIIIPLSVGISKIKPSRFLMFSIISGVLWASFVSMVGYLAGHFFDLDTNDFEKNIFFIVAGFAIIGLLTGYIVRKVTLSRLEQK